MPAKRLDRRFSARHCSKRPFGNGGGYKVQDSQGNRICVKDYPYHVDAPRVTVTSVIIKLLQWAQTKMREAEGQQTKH